MPHGPPNYPVLVRITHWLNAVVLLLLVLSGFEIFNANPTLYLSDASDEAHKLLTLPDFPAWMTMGGWLAGGRRLHLAAAWIFSINGAIYLAFMLSAHRKWKVWFDISDLPDVWSAVRGHLRFPPVLDGPNGGLNPLQKAAYLSIPLILSPLIIATGLALSPQWDAIFPFWTDLFGGRQFARTWHFAFTWAFIGFVAGHIVLVCLAGWPTFIRMVSGRVE